MLVLFFDTFIISSLDKGGLYNFSYMEEALSQYRDKFPTYKWQSKIEIVKYTLTSYSKINWDKVVIRYECEDEFDTIPFYNFCKDIFPNAIIENERSASAKQYYEALSRLDNEENPWIFFSPNNDHPYISDPQLLLNYLNYAEALEHQYNGNNISVLYSHFTESMIDNKITDPQWGYFESNFKKIVFENYEYIATVSNKLVLDSIKIYRLNYLLNIFYKTNNEGRVIRLEDTEFHMSKSNELITIAPKKELCRHYDSYAHLMRKVPPLFIPFGFFEYDIKIRYGYDMKADDFITINPLSKQIDLDTDLNCLFEDTPHFWNERISVIDINPSFNYGGEKLNLEYYRNLNNPFHSNLPLQNVFLSFRRWILKFNPFTLIRIVELLKKIRLYNLVRKWYNQLK